jgi:hypothetical protein
VLLEVCERFEQQLGVLCLISDSVSQATALYEFLCRDDVGVIDVGVTPFFGYFATNSEEIDRLACVAAVLRCDRGCPRNRGFLADAIDERAIGTVSEDCPKFARVVRAERDLALHQCVFDFRGERLPEGVVVVMPMTPPFEFVM